MRLTAIELRRVHLPLVTPFRSAHGVEVVRDALLVRAVTADGDTPWSANFGFDMVPPAPPTPLQSYPGMLRWTPVEGAAGYQVWLVDAHKKEQSVTPRRNRLGRIARTLQHQTYPFIRGELGTR